MVNGVISRNANDFVYPGDVVVCRWEESIEDTKPSDDPLDVVYEDEWLMVVNKGPHMLIHPTSKEPQHTLVNAAAGYYLRRGIEAGIHPIYRLDRNTTGLVIIAKCAKVQADLSRSHDQICRRYFAVAEGILPDDRGIIERPIGRKEGSIIEWMVRDDGKPALTEYEVLARRQDRTFLRLRLHTGRTHQIRVHLSSLGHPLMGDDLYGGHTGAISRQALHAGELFFTHPMTGENMHLTAPVPADMKALLPDFPFGSIFQSPI